MTLHCYFCGEDMLKHKRHVCREQFKLGDCSSCYDSDVLLTLSSNEEAPNSYVCKECFLRGL